MTNIPKFNLLNQPWIPCRTLQNTRVDLSVLEVLKQAHRLEGISDPSPLAQYSTYRFMAAVLQVAFPVQSDLEWKELWDQGCFCEEILQRIETLCAGRFDLFHPTQPFYQSGDISLTEKTTETLKTVGYLFYEASTGTNITHFSHPGDRDHAACPKCCAKGLLIQPSFASSGGAGIKPSINGVPPIYVMPRGETLFATLLLNHLIPDYQPVTAIAGDETPIWARDGITEARTERVGATFLESLSWPARRMRLFPSIGGICTFCGSEAEILVRKVVYSQGWSLPKEMPLWEDPWVAYRDRQINGKIERKSVMPQEEKSLWRDFPVLFLLPEDRSSKRPAVLSQLDELLHYETLPKSTPVHYEAVSLRTDMKAKIFEWNHHTFEFSPSLLGAPVMHQIEEALSQAETLAGSLRISLKFLHPIMYRSKPDKTAVRNALRGTIQQALADYWNALEPIFRQMVCDERLLQGESEKGSWLQDWRDQIKACALTIIDQVTERFQNGEEARRQQKARGVFFAQLRKWEGGES